jgi:hypothetical protein
MMAKPTTEEPNSDKFWLIRNSKTLLLKRELPFLLIVSCNMIDPYVIYDRLPACQLCYLMAFSQAGESIYFIAELYPGFGRFGT